MNKSQIDLIKEWLGRIAKAQKFHFKRHIYCLRWHLIIGILLIIFSIISTMMAFYLLNYAGIISIIVLIIASIQTFLNLGRLSEEHLRAAKNYDNLKVELEHLLGFSSDDNQINNTLPNIISRWQIIIKESPALSPKMYESLKLQ
jgi:hypothetical protein